jgi:8-oxo-dGTP pyrophosphatase MutT (NUDIX family)
MMFFKARRNRVTLGAQAVVADSARRVLLVRHGYRPGWHFPGGGVERAESVLTALTRELEEEAGVVLAAPPRLFGIYSHFDAFPGDHILLFVAAEWRQARVPEPNREIAEMGFFALDALPEGTTQQTRRRCAEVFLGQEKSEAW